MIRPHFNTYAVLEKIERRPSMYIGKSSLWSLKSFLDGYTLAMCDAGVTDIAEPDFHGFHAWVAKKFGFYEATAGWANMILAVALGYDAKTIDWEVYADSISKTEHEESLNMFWKLLLEYRGLSSQTCHLILFFPKTQPNPEFLLLL